MKPKNDETTQSWKQEIKEYEKYRAVFGQKRSFILDTSRWKFGILVIILVTRSKLLVYVRGF